MKKALAAGLTVAFVLVLFLAVACSSGTPTPTTGQFLVFTTQPTGAIAGRALTAQPVVAVKDALEIVTGSSAPVAISITPGAGTSDATILGTMGTGTITVNAVKGVATFGNLAIVPPGSGYTLTATSPGLTPAISKPFDVVPAPMPTYAP